MSWLDYSRGRQRGQGGRRRLPGLLLLAALALPALPGAAPAGAGPEGPCWRGEPLGQLLLVAVPQGSWAAMATFRRSLRTLRIGGVILYEYNVRALRSREAVARYVAGLQEGLPVPLLMAIDHEGGAVQRLKPRQGFTDLPPAAAVGRAAQPAAEARRLGRIAGRELAAAGIHMNLAPVLDVAPADGASHIARWARAFSADPDAAGRLGAAFIAGLQAEGVLAVGKHFPGIGSLARDSHDTAPVLERSRAALRRREWVPFRRAVAAGVDGIMLAHVRLPAVAGPDTLAPFSPALVQGVLREELGFAGLVVTDDLAMAPVRRRHSTGAAAVAALLAGADLLMLTDASQRAVLDHLCAVLAAGDARAARLRARIDASLRRIRAARARVLE